MLHRHILECICDLDCYNLSAHVLTSLSHSHVVPTRISLLVCPLLFCCKWLLPFNFVLHVHRHFRHCAVCAAFTSHLLVLCRYSGQSGSPVWLYWSAKNTRVIIGVLSSGSAEDGETFTLLTETVFNELQAYIGSWATSISSAT